MDPDENLREQRHLAVAMINAADNDGSQIDPHQALRLAELARDLDAWLTRGGALPRAWRQRPAPIRKATLVVKPKARGL